MSREERDGADAVVALATIEARAAELAVPAWQFAGLKRAEGWGEGKQVTAAEFAAALERFRTAGLCGLRKRAG